MVIREWMTLGGGSQLPGPRHATERTPRGGSPKGSLPQPTARLKMQDVKGPVCQHDASYCKRVQVLPLRQLVRDLGTSGTSPSGSCQKSGTKSEQHYWLAVL